MKKLLVFVLSIAMVGFFSMPESAEAKRFGGGKSFGKSFKYSRQAKPRQSTPQKDRTQAAPGKQAVGGAAPRRGGLMGPIAGLAAGGLLAAMFFGGAFEGFQMFDFLMIGLLAFVGFQLLRRFTVNKTQHTYSGAGAGGASPYSAPQQRETMPASQRTTTFDVPEIGAGLGNQSLAVKPDWFSEPSFMAEAESHFRRLQSAWDNGDMAAIKDYVTPDMFAHVSAQQQGQSAHTEVIDLSSQLLDLLDDGEDVIAAILFNGVLSEDGQAPAEFAEIWHVRHPAASADGDWLIDGIRQHA